jgi:probable rRNA maturation factor
MIRLAEKGAGRRLPAAARKRLAARLERALGAAGEGGAEVSLLLCGDAQIRALNRGYADEDHATDVLSFSQREGWGAPDAGLLGDIVVSVETAARQARERPGRPAAALEAEILHLGVHGLCHLLGLDHDTPAHERAMWAREAELRAAATAPRRRPRRPAPR